jgi:hypothetical protein
MTGNGQEPTWVYCQFNDSHKFLTLNERYQHEPSCPNNPGRIPEDKNPER